MPHCCSPPRTRRRQGEEPDPPRRQGDPLGRHRFVIVFGILAWKAWPAIKKALKDREDRIRGDLERPRQARLEAETSLDDYQQAARRGAQRGRARSSRRPALAAEQVRQERIAAIDGEIAELRARAADDIRLATERAMSDLQRQGRRAVDRAGREGRRAQPRPRHPDRAHRELHQPGREQLDRAAECPRRGVRERAARGRRAEGQLGEVEDELFRFARTFEGSDELRMALSDPTPARRTSGGGRRGSARAARPCSTSIALASFVVGLRSGRRAARRSSTGSSSSRRRSVGTRWPRCAARWRSRPEQRRSAARGAEPGNRQGRRGEGRRRSDRARRHRRPSRRHRDRRLGPSSPRAAEGTDLMGDTRERPGEPTRSERRHA